jgi:hypothetical protein
MKFRRSQQSLYYFLVKAIFLLSLLDNCCRVTAGNPRSARLFAEAERAVKEQETLQLATEAPSFVSTSNNISGEESEDPCFGVDALKGSWNVKTRKFESSNCDIEPIRYGLFEDQSSKSRLRLAQCFSNRKWVVLMGDSNSRGMFNIICDILTKTLGGKSVFRFGGDETNKHGDQRWSDRECIFPGSKTIGPFRFSFRFYNNYDRFKIHLQDKFQQDLEHDNTLEKQQIRGSLFERYVVPKGDGYPSVLLISSGLWDLKCQSIKDTYEILNGKLHSSIPNILFFPPAHIFKHPTISNSMIEGIHHCLIEKRNSELIDVMDRRSFFKSQQQKPGIVPILDVYKMTEKMPLEWIKGYHFANSKNNPIAQAVISYLLRFACK